MTETASEATDTLDISDEDPFSNMFDLSMLRPQSPFISDRNKVPMFRNTSISSTILSGRDVGKHREAGYSLLANINRKYNKADTKNNPSDHKKNNTEDNKENAN